MYLNTKDDSYKLLEEEKTATVVITRILQIYDGGRSQGSNEDFTRLVLQVFKIRAKQRTKHQDVLTVEDHTHKVPGARKMH